MMNGVIVVDKPEGITSFDCIRKVKPFLKNEKIGHLGTLDPIATGVLPLLFGKATKLFDALSADEKSYLAEMRFGIQTDTADRTGRTIRTKNVPHCTPEDITNAFSHFIGGYLQKPPAYSAKKHDGEPLYKKARNGEDVSDLLEPTFVNVYSADLLNYDPLEQTCIFRVTSGKGFYVRSFIEDVAEMLDTVATMTSLRRIQVGHFSLDKAINIDTISGREELESALLPLEAVTAHLPTLCVSDDVAARVINGARLDMDVFRRLTGFVRVVDKSQRLLAVGCASAKRFEFIVVVGDSV